MREGAKEEHSRVRGQDRGRKSWAGERKVARERRREEVMRGRAAEKAGVK